MPGRQMRRDQAKTDKAKRVRYVTSNITSTQSESISRADCVTAATGLRNCSYIETYNEKYNEKYNETLYVAFVARLTTRTYACLCVLTSQSWLAHTTSGHLFAVVAHAPTLVARTSCPRNANITHTVNAREREILFSRAVRDHSRMHPLLPSAILFNPQNSGSHLR